MFEQIVRGIAKRAAPFAALAMGAALSGCAYVSDWDYDVSGVELSELDMSGAAPTEIALAGPDTLIITEGDTLTIEVTGDAQAGEALRFDLDNQSLTIARDSKVYDGSGKAIVNITMPAPEGVAVAGSGRIEVATLAENAELAVGGSGAMEIASIATQTLEIAIGGSGEVKGSGTTERLEIAIGGSGQVDMPGLKANRAEISIGGSGDVAFASDGTVEASIGGSGDIVVTGNAKCTLSSMGSGTLTCNPTSETADAAAE